MAQEELNGQNVVKKCTCKSDFQDAVYGKNNRLHSVGGSKGTRKYKCTVCSEKK